MSYKMNSIQDFYNHPCFESLQETRPFIEYLQREKQKLESCRIYGDILDIGCGDGRNIKVLARLGDYISGVDFSERLLTKAGYRIQGIKNAELFLEDAKSTHFEDLSFDIITMLWNTFGNLYSSRDMVLQEAKRVLKPGGKILMSVFSENVLPAYLDLLDYNGLDALKYNDDYVFLKEGLVSERFTKDKIEQICISAGLIPSIERLTDIAYWCEITK